MNLSLWNCLEYKEKEIMISHNLFFVLLFFESCVLYELQSPSLYQITSTLLFFLTISVSLRTSIFYHNFQIMQDDFVDL